MRNLYEKRDAYKKFCKGYWQKCFQCPEFMIDKIDFCKKFNRKNDKSLQTKDIQIHSLLQDKWTTCSPSAKATIEKVVTTEG